MHFNRLQLFPACLVSLLLTTVVGAKVGRNTRNIFFTEIFFLQSLSAHSDSSEQTTVKVKVKNPRENYFLWKLFGFGRDRKLKRARHSSAGNCASRRRHLELLRIQTKYFNLYKIWIINQNCNLLELFILGSRQKTFTNIHKIPGMVFG